MAADDCKVNLLLKDQIQTKPHYCSISFMTTWSQLLTWAAVIFPFTDIDIHVKLTVVKCMHGAFSSLNKWKGEKSFPKERQWGCCNRQGFNLQIMFKGQGDAVVSTYHHLERRFLQFSASVPVCLCVALWHCGPVQGVISPTDSKSPTQEQIHCATIVSQQANGGWIEQQQSKVLNVKNVIKSTFKNSFHLISEIKWRLKGTVGDFILFTIRLQSISSAVTL